MKRKDFILALLVVIVWGVNFTIIKIGLSGLPSMLLVALRYLFTAIPAIFFIKRPKIQFKYVFIYGFTIGVIQFGALFYAMEIGMPAGLASILLQLQAFISPFLAFIFFKEKFNFKQIIGFFIAAIGLFFIGTASGIDGITNIPIIALALTVFSATAWSLSNVIARTSSEKAVAKGDHLDMLSLVVWSSLIPPLPLLGIALLLDTPQTLLHAIYDLNFLSIFSGLYLAYGATLFGYSIWSKLIVKYPLGKVAPLSLLVPITGLLSARIVLLEKLSKMQWIGALVILIGLVVTSVDFAQMKDKIFKQRKQKVITEQDSDNFQN